jgi:hypothetical protein
MWKELVTMTWWMSSLVHLTMDCRSGRKLNVSLTNYVINHSFIPLWNPLWAPKEYSSLK